MQCKDIPDLPILEHLSNHVGQWCFLIDESICGYQSIFLAMPTGTPFKLAKAKMGRLIQRGLVSGCDCGCRGDFEITDKGIEYLRSMKNQSGDNSCSQQS